LRVKPIDQHQAYLGQGEHWLIIPCIFVQSGEHFERFGEYLFNQLSGYQIN
jgi:TRAP-type mannitol/chloroaromatic compound transport system permease small subunit